MFETFCLRLSAGMALALLVLPGGLTPRFHRIHLLIVLGLGVTAALAGAERSSEVFWLALGLGLGGSLAGSWAWSLEGAPGGTACLVVTWLALTIAAVDVSAGTGASPGRLIAVIGDELTAAWLLGIALTAMLMGHWYLIAPTMSLQPLLRLLASLFIVLGLRAVTAGVSFIVWTGGSGDSLSWLWLAVRWAVGLAGPAVLGYMAWQSARIRSTQSATGILYVVVVFVFLGELTALLLAAHTGQRL